MIIKYTKHMLFCLLIIFSSQTTFAENTTAIQSRNCEESTSEGVLSVNKNNLTPEEQEGIEVLINGGDVDNLCVDSDTISYMRNVYVTAGRTPQFDKRVTTCVETYFSISRVGLNVRSYGREPVLSGTPVVRIEGDITRELKGSFDEYSITVRRDLERNFHRRERGNRTNFPVLGNFSPSKISAAFRVLSKN
jgi:hypothetical protein